MAKDYWGYFEYDESRYGGSVVCRLCGWEFGGSWDEITFDEILDVAYEHLKTEHQNIFKKLEEEHKGGAGDGGV